MLTPPCVDVPPEFLPKPIGGEPQGVRACCFWIKLCFNLFKIVHHLSNCLGSLFVEQQTGHAIQNGLRSSSSPEGKYRSSACLRLNWRDPKIFFRGKYEGARFLHVLEQNRVRLIAEHFDIWSGECLRSGIFEKASTIKCIFLYGTIRDDVR
jgi:hypothetical protein